MANTRVSEFAANSALNGSEVVLGVQSGNTVKIAMDDIKTFAKTSFGDYVATDTLLTDVATEYVSLSLELNTNYVIDCLLIFSTTNTDGLRIDRNIGEDIVIENLVYTVDNTQVGSLSTELNVADATGVLFVRISGFLQTSVTEGANDFGILVKTITNVIGTTELLAGSYLLATKI